MNAKFKKDNQTYSNEKEFVTEKADVHYIPNNSLDNKILKYKRA